MNENYSQEIRSMLVDPNEEIIDALSRNLILTNKRLYWRADYVGNTAQSATEQVMDLSRVKDNSVNLVYPKKKPLDPQLTKLGLILFTVGLLLLLLFKNAIGGLMFVIGIATIGFCIYKTKPDEPYVEFSIEYRYDKYSSRYVLADEQRMREFNKKLIVAKEKLGLV